MLFNIELPKKLGKINYFKKEEKGCKLISYNGNVNDVYIVMTYEDFEIEKDFCVANTTLEAINKLQPNVDVKINEKSITATSKKGKYNSKYLINSITIPSILDCKTCTLDISKLVKATNFTSTNEKKPILTGVNVNENGTIIATDSFKLYRYMNDVNNINNSNSNITIDAGFIKIVDSIFEDKVVNASYDKRQILVSSKNIMVYGRLIDGNYPDVNRIFNSCTEEKFLIEKPQLLECINITKIGGADSNKNLNVTLDNDKFIGNGGDEFEATIKYGGAKISLNGNNLGLGLNVFDNDNLTITNHAGLMILLEEENKFNEQVILLGYRQ